MEKITCCQHKNEDGSLSGCKGRPTSIKNGIMIFAKGYCCMHYARFKKYGDANFVKYIYGEYRPNHPLYNNYHSMKTRCYNENHTHYKNYGGRGIVMSDEWFNDFNAFCRDMGEKPTPQHSIERDDVNGNYCKENCRWATKHEQMANTRRSNKNVGVYFVKKTKKWHSYLQVNKKNHQKSFNTETEAINYRKYLVETYLK